MFCIVYRQKGIVKQKVTLKNVFDWTSWRSFVRQSKWYELEIETVTNMTSCCLRLRVEWTIMQITKLMEQGMWSSLCTKTMVQ